MKGSKTKGITILARTRYIFYGGGMASLREGCRLAQDNGRVLIALPGSCLLPELCDTFSWQADAETAALFPEEVRDGGLLQPDRAKRYLEELCQELRIGLLTVTACAEEIPGKRFGPVPAAVLLDHLQEKAMQTYGQRKREDPSLVLGRFAPLMKPSGDRRITLTEWTEEVRRPVRQKRCDVLVAGGGTAGALAALHAARGGAETVLIERQYALGGTSTVGGVSTYWFGNRYRAVREIDRETDRYMEQLGLPRKPGIWSDSDDFHPGVRAWVL